MNLPEDSRRAIQRAIDAATEAMQTFASWGRHLDHESLTLLGERFRAVGAIFAREMPDDSPASTTATLSLFVGELVRTIARLDRELARVPDRPLIRAHRAELRGALEGLQAAGILKRKGGDSPCP